MLKNNRLTALALIAAAVLFLAGYAPGQFVSIAKAAEAAVDIKDAPGSAEENKPLLLTLEELKEFDGKDGRRAYVAVDGIIYDVTDSALWRNGSHNGFEAGQDLTKPIKEQSPHGVGKLQNVVEVGRLRVLLTLEELKEFDGKDGRRAYVAVDGIIYDVTDSALWRNGSHNGFEAGQDLTKPIKEQSPHGVGKLKNVVEIGLLKVELTLEELKEYNGKDGKRAFVAVDGIIYDVTDSALWRNGSHNGFEAGQDLTKPIKEQSPHGVGKLENVVEIGVLVE